MTSTPVKSAGFGLNGLLPSGAGPRVSADGGFQAVWNNQTGKQADSAEQPQDNQTVKKAPGDSLKARDEHRVRTNKREPSRDVEERTDIPDEKLEEAAEVLEAAAVRIIEDVADAFGVEPAEVQKIMTDLGLEETDILSTEGLGSLILAVSGEESPQALLTNEALYENYQELMGELKSTLQECGEILEVSPERLTEMVQQKPQQPDEAEEPIPVEVVKGPEEAEKPDGGIERVPEENREIVKPAVQKPAEERSVEQKSAEEKPAEERPAEQKTGEQKIVSEKPAEEPRDNRDTGENHGRRENQHENGRDQGVNLFAQSFKAQQPEVQVQQTYSTESAWDADTQNIMRQIMDYMKVNIKADMTTMEMQLHPASLGTVQVQIAARGGAVTASFITQNEAVKAAIESQVVQLQEQFQEQGVKVEAIEVTVQTHQFEQNLEQGRRGGGQEQEPARKGRTRRISLNDSIPAEEMEEEDLLAKDIMAANGNTVDYTA